MSFHAGDRSRVVARWVLAVVVFTLVLADVLVARPRPAAAGTPPGEVLPAVLDGWADRSLPGTLAAVVARQHRVVPGLSPKAADARAARTTAAWADNGAAAARSFPTASMVKLFMAEDLLHRDRTDELALPVDDRILLRRMLTSSDDPAASALWVRYDGDRMVRAVARRYDLTGTAPPPIPGQWGQTVTTARDLARFLTLLPVLAHPDDADTILGWMGAATPTAADGFDQRFGLFGDRAAVKQGWMCCIDGNRHVHSVGVVGRTVVVLLSEVPRRVDYDEVRDALTSAAAQVPPARLP